MSLGSQNKLFCGIQRPHSKVKVRAFKGVLELMGELFFFNTRTWK